MANLLNKLMSGAKQYSVLDFGMLKFALLFVGILLGTYFWEFFSQYLCVIWVLAVICYGYIIISTLKKAFCKRKENETEKR